jgi:hypothetical protein
MKSFSQITIALLAMSSVAVAQPKQGDKPVAPTKEAKAVEQKPAMPTVPPELVEMAKSATGTWKCKGESMEPDGSKSIITAVNKSKADLDKWWIVENLEVKGMKAMGPLKITTYTTFDAASKKWRRVSMTNSGGQMVGTADATPMGQPMVFNLDTLGPMGAGQFRDHTDPSDMKTAGLKVWGEMTLDKGKTWIKVYEMACKK